MEMMMELMHPRRLEKKANIRSNRPWSGMWPGLSQAAAIVRSDAERPRANQDWLSLIATDCRASRVLRLSWNRAAAPLARLPAWQAPKRDELINIISPVLTQQFGADTLVFGATSERIVSRRDDFYYDATGSPKDDAETAISLVQNKGMQSVRAEDFPLPDDAPFRVVKVFFPTLQGYFSMTESSRATGAGLITTTKIAA